MSLMVRRVRGRRRFAQFTGSIERCEDRLLLSAHPVLEFSDDFSGATVNAATWSTPTGAASFYGRTQIRAPEVPVAVDAGAAHLRLDTFNPTANTPGDS